MKKYLLSQSDVDAIVAALTVLPAYGFFASDIAEAAFAVTASAGQKLVMQQKLTSREISLISLAVNSACEALRGELSLDSENLARLRPYLFTYNHLQSIFASARS